MLDLTLDLQGKLLASVLLGFNSVPQIREMFPEHRFTGPAKSVWDVVSAAHDFGEPVDEVVAAMRCPGAADRISLWVEWCVTPENASIWAAEIVRQQQTQEAAESLRLAHEAALSGRQFDTYLEEAREKQPHRQLSDISLTSVIEFGDWGHAPPEPRYLFETMYSEGVEPEGAYPGGRAGMLVAEGGAGKTWALIQLGISLVSGQDWLDYFRPVERGPVLMLLGEEIRQEVYRRVYHATEDMDRECLEDLYIEPLAGQHAQLVALDSAGNPVLTDYYKRLMQTISKRDWTAIVIDPIARFACQGVENDAAIATRFVTAVESFTQLPGEPSVLVAHHSNKASRGGVVTTAGASRGSSALTDGVRWQANMEAMPLYEGQAELVTFRVTKSNQTRKVAPVTLARGREGMLVKASRHDVEAWWDEHKRRKKGDQ
jgi:hypothetical protein